MLTTRLGEAASNPLFIRTNPATLSALRTATVLDWDPDMRRNVPTDPLLTQQPKVRESTLGRQRAACPKQKSASIHIHVNAATTSACLSVIG